MAYIRKENCIEKLVKLISLTKGHQIAHGPRPDLEIRQPIGLMGGPAHCY